MFRRVLHAIPHQPVAAGLSGRFISPSQKARLHILFCDTETLVGHLESVPCATGSLQRVGPFDALQSRIWTSSRRRRRSSGDRYSRRGPLPRWLRRARSSWSLAHRACRKEVNCASKQIPNWRPIYTYTQPRKSSRYAFTHILSHASHAGKA